eukprot:GHVN01039911.1.p1 GENE.GHVN01039911.1~~GHVN01039911.1.p1  ORF type:complete len:128 (-),score=11.62 GHVN01039911.1:88-471(-)
MTSVYTALLDHTIYVDHTFERAFESLRSGFHVPINSPEGELLVVGGIVSAIVLFMVAFMQAGWIQRVEKYSRLEAKGVRERLAPSDMSSDLDDGSHPSLDSSPEREYMGDPGTKPTGVQKRKPKSDS